jgi:hypothetical protein
MTVDLSPAPAGNVGFLSVLQEASGHIGGYLVTNSWGRPLEFRLTSAVQPNRIQQLLYGDSLMAYIAGDLIGRALLEKTTTAVALVLTDNPFALELRQRSEVPVALWQPNGGEAAGLFVQPNLVCHSRFAGDVSLMRGLFEKMNLPDLGEPFVRIREAMGEARKMGVASRGAA